MLGRNQRKIKVNWAKEGGKSPREVKLARANKAAADRASRVLSLEASSSVPALNSASCAGNADPGWRIRDWRCRPKCNCRLPNRPNQQRIRERKCPTWSREQTAVLSGAFPESQGGPEAKLRLRRGLCRVSAVMEHCSHYTSILIKFI